jgi:protein involved in polysaccharide export with SLBB domain
MTPPFSARSRARHALVAVCLSLVSASGAFGQAANPGAIPDPASSSGPIRLRQPQVSSPGQGTAPDAKARESDRTQKPTSPLDADDERRLRDFKPGAGEQPLLLPEAYRPSEFERYVQRITNNRDIRRFGADLIVEEPNVGRVEGDLAAAVPADYVLAAGDEVVLNLWGSVDADLRLPVDRSGRIHVPRIGSILVAGTRYADLPALIQRQAARTFKNFELSVSLGQLRGVRVFVTGFVAKPGVYSVHNLSTVSSVLFAKAGGPAVTGSWRNIEIRRNGAVAARIDLYQLLSLGQNTGDELVRAGDVIHVGAVGPLVALVGSVNKEAVYELKASETLADLLRLAGGLSAVAEKSRLAVERLDERSEQRVRQVALPADANLALASGDVVRAFSAIDSVLPLQRQNKRVKVEGEVLRPGDYILPPASTIADAIKAAGGLTGRAFVFGAEFTRESVRRSQQENYERALRDFELEMARTGAVPKPSEDAQTLAARQLSSDRLLDRLRNVKPNGRVVLQLPPEASELPNLALEDGDRLHVPALPTTVGVFGSVPNAGSYLYSDQRLVKDYLQLAGSPLRSADERGVFVVRANGSVVSDRQGSWFGSAVLGTGPIDKLAALPGDTVYVPEDLWRVSTLTAAKDWTTTFYNLVVSLAAVRTATR